MTQCIDDGALKTALEEATKEIVDKEVMTKNELVELVEAIKKDMQAGLQGPHTVPMIPSFVSKQPTGKEVGNVVTIDLGGTNLRVCFFNLKGHGNYDVQQRHKKVPESVKAGLFAELANFVAEAVLELLRDCMPDRDMVNGPVLELGYTFSFPVISTSVADGTLHMWTSGYTCPDAIGENPARLLQESFDKKHANIRVKTLTMDVVATLIAHAYGNPKTNMAMILGTGFNVGIFEKVKNIHNWATKEQEEAAQSYDEMILDTELCKFYSPDHSIPLNKYEYAMDQKTTNPREFVCEKIIGGMYIGEITRHMLLDLVNQGLLFAGGRSIGHLNEVWKFEAQHMSRIETDVSPDLKVVKDILESELRIQETTLIERQAVKELVQAVGLKSAQYTACNLAAAMSHMSPSPEEYVVGIDGSLFYKYPYYEERIRSALDQIVGQDIQQKVTLERTRDGSSLGTAVIALTH